MQLSVVLDIFVRYNNNSGICMNGKIFVVCCRGITSLCQNQSTLDFCIQLSVCTT